MAETTSEIKNTLSSFGIRSIWDVLIGDKPIWIIYLVLSCFSLVVVYSSSSMVIFHGGEFNSTNVLIKQFGLLAVGILIAAGTLLSLGNTTERNKRISKATYTAK